MSAKPGAGLATDALTLAAVDVYFVGRRRISPIYLLDGVVELGLVAARLVPEKGAELTHPDTNRNPA